MKHVSPAGPMYQAGTLSGNPLGMAAGLATLRELKANPGIYKRLDEKTRELAEKVIAYIEKNDLPCSVNQLGSMITVFFTKELVRGWAESSKSNTKQFGLFFHAMLAEGCHLPPAQFEAWFLSNALTDENWEHLATATTRALDRVFEG